MNSAICRFSTGEQLFMLLHIKEHLKKIKDLKKVKKLFKVQKFLFGDKYNHHLIFISF